MFANEHPAVCGARHADAAPSRALAEKRGLPCASRCLGMSAIHALSTERSSPAGSASSRRRTSGQTARSSATRAWARAGRSSTSGASPSAGACRRRPALLYVGDHEPASAGGRPRRARVVHARGGLLAVDATFATPSRTAAERSADIILHSLTKYSTGTATSWAVVNWSSDWVAALTDRKDPRQGVPATAALARARSLRTLDVRWPARTDSRWRRHLAHPGRASTTRSGTHPQHALAKRQFGGRFGAIVRPRGRHARAPSAPRRARARAPTTLGDITPSLYPPTSSHRRFAGRLGITDGFVRLSVGIEDPADIIADLDAALARV